MSEERTVMFQMPTVLSGTLDCVRGTCAGHSWELSAGTFVIGRSPECDLSLPQEPGVSKIHAKIIAEGDRYVLLDCESLNGSIVNGAPVQRAELRDGDEIRICGCLLRFTQRGGPAGLNPQEPEYSDDVTGPALVVPPMGPAPSSAVDLPIGAVSMQAAAAETAASDPSALPAEAFTRAPAESAAPPPARAAWTKTLLGWYAAGFAGALLFGIPGVVLARSPAVNADTTLLSPDPQPFPVGKDVPTTVPTDAPATVPTDAPATVPTSTPSDAPADVATDVATNVPSGTPARPPVALSTGGEPPSRAVGVDEPQGAAARAARAVRVVEASAARSEREYAATPSRPRAGAIKARRAGTVRSVEVSEGDVVRRGDVLVTFEGAAAQGDEVATLRDRVASLEAVAGEDEQARRELKVAQAKLDALTGGTGPLKAPVAGRVVALQVAPGDEVKPGAVLVRLGGSDSRRVRVTVSADHKVAPGSQVTLVLAAGGMGEGRVVKVSGSVVLVDTGATPPDAVKAVRF